MSKKKFLSLLKVFIFLLPIPFGCVGRFFNPLFYLILLILSLLALGVEETRIFKNIKVAPVQKDKFLGNITGRKGIMISFKIFLFFLIFQLIPLPIGVLKVISPKVVEVLSLGGGSLPGFHPISMVPSESLFFLFKFLVIIIFFVSVSSIRFTKTDIISFFNTLILSVSIQAVFGIIKYATGNEYFFLFFRKMAKEMTFVTGTLGNPDHFAFWVEMTIPLVLSLFFLKIRLYEGKSSLKDKILAAYNENWKVFLYLLTFILLGVTVFLTGARAGIITMVISLILFMQLTVYNSWTRRFRGKMKYLLIILGLVVVFVGVSNTVNKFLNSSYTEGGRADRWPASITLVKDFPVAGTGFGTYKYSFLPYDISGADRWSTHAHNEYLEILSDGGLLGTLLLLVMAYFILSSLIKMWLKRRHPQMKILGIGCLSSLFVALFHSLMDFSLRIPSNVLILVIILLLGFKICTYKKEFKNG